MPDLGIPIGEPSAPGRTTSRRLAAVKPLTRWRERRDLTSRHPANGFPLDFFFRQIFYATLALSQATLSRQF